MSLQDDDFRSLFRLIFDKIACGKRILFAHNAFLHTYCTSNAGNFLVIRKNTKLQNETIAYLPHLTVNNIGFLQHLLFGLVPVYVCVKKLYFYQVLEQKNTKHLGCCSTFGKCKSTLACMRSRILPLSENLATSRVHGSRYPARKTIQ